MQRPHIRRSNCNLIRIAHRNNAVCIINIAYIVCINDSTAGTLQEIPYIGSLQKLLQGNISHRIFPTIIQTDLHRPVRCQYMTDLGTLDRVYHILVLDIQHSCLYFILPQHRTCVRTRAQSSSRACTSVSHNRCSSDKVSITAKQHSSLSQ